MMQPFYSQLIKWVTGRAGGTGKGGEGIHINENPDYSGGYMRESKLIKLYTSTYAVYHVWQIYLNKT